MFLKTLSISGFRNLSAQTLHFSNKVSIITGANGQGKTSLLEAVYLLSHSKSFRTASLENLMRWKNGKSSPEEHAPCRVEAEVDTANGLVTIAFEIQGRSRAVYVNGKQAKRASSFFGQLTSVVFTPEELQLIKGQPVLRRQSVDRILAMVDPLFVDTLVQYQRALKQRNAVLSRSAPERAMLGADLQIWDALLVKHGRLIVEKRQQFLADIGPRVMDFYQQIAEPRSREALAMEYKSDFLVEHEVQGEEELRQKFFDLHPKDFRQQSTSFGVHRDDIVFTLDSGHGAKLARVSASQGQVRSSALSYKFAAIDYLLRNTGEAPVVLLDDVESELDQKRRRALYELLGRFESQVLLTATEAPNLPVELLINTEKFEIFEGLVRNP